MNAEYSQVFSFKFSMEDLIQIRKNELLLINGLNYLKFDLLIKCSLRG